MANLDPGVIESVINSNFKSLAEMGAINALSHQNRIQVLAEKALAKSLENMDTTDVPEGLGLSAAQRGDLAKQISDLAAAVASMQASIKGGQTVPPVTP
jgi:hypothetical protein